MMIFSLTVNKRAAQQRDESALRFLAFLKLRMTHSKCTYKLEQMNCS